MDAIFTPDLYCSFCNQISSLEPWSQPSEFRYFLHYILLSSDLHLYHRLIREHTILHGPLQWTLLALYFLIYWHLAKVGNELALKNIESEVNDISRASEFNFPHPVDWEETKKTMERFSLALHFGLQGGFVSKILLFPDKMYFILTC